MKTYRYRFSNSLLLNQLNFMYHGSNRQPLAWRRFFNEKKMIFSIGILVIHKRQNYYYFWSIWFFKVIFSKNCWFDFLHRNGNHQHFTCRWLWQGKTVSFFYSKPDTRKEPKSAHNYDISQQLISMFLKTTCFTPPTNVSMNNFSWRRIFSKFISFSRG